MNIKTKKKNINLMKKNKSILHSANIQLSFSSISFLNQLITIFVQIHCKSNLLPLNYKLKFNKVYHKNFLSQNQQ